jgi:hypothetical protein
MLPVALLTQDVPYKAPEPPPGEPLVVIAYALFWVIAVLFLIAMYRRQSRIELEMKALAKQLEGDGSRR